MLEERGGGAEGSLSDHMKGGTEDGEEADKQGKAAP